MSATGSNSSGDLSGLQPVVVLVRPQLGENIGAACRAMLNFGIERLRIVAPRDGWPNPDSAAMASGADRVLDGARVFDDIGTALADLNYVFATTARRRDLDKEVFDVRAAMKRAVGLARDGQRTGLLFGPERSGLVNAEIARANAVVSVPVNPEFPSLNLAQAVLLLAYEWRAEAARAAPRSAFPQGDLLATSGEVRILVDRIEESLAERGFFRPESKADGMKLNLRNLFSRLPLSDRDVRLLHGVVRSLSRKPPGGR